MALRRALAARARTTVPNPMVGAVVVDDEGVVVGRGVARVRRRPARRSSSRLREAGAARARRDAVLHARAVLPHRPHRPVRAGVVDAGIAPRGGRGRGSESAVNGARPRDPARARHRGDVGVGRRGGARLNRAFFSVMHAPAAVRDDEGRAQPRRHDRGGAGRAHAADRPAAATASSTANGPRSTPSPSDRAPSWPTIRC